MGRRRGDALLDRGGNSICMFRSKASIRPRPQKEDFPDLPGFLDYANAIYRAEGLWDGVQARFGGLPHYHLHKGYLPGTLDRDGFPDRIAYLHIDLNVRRWKLRA